MVSIIDSTAHFSSRAIEIGLTDDVVQIFIAKDIGSMGNFGFAHGQPGQPIVEADFTAWLTRILGMEPDLATVARAKRLLFEAHVLVTSHLRSQIEGTTDSAEARKIPPAERVARLERLAEQLKGIDLSGPMLPAHSLLNEVCHQAESQVLRYITPSKCPSRETEILNLKLEKELSIEHNTLKIKDKDQAIPVDTGSEFLIYQALVRRCVAYAFANLIAFDIQHKWITFLFKLLSKDVPQGYSRVTLGQILAADKAAYVYMAEHCTDLKPDPIKMPLNEVMQAMPTNFEVMLFAQPLPRAPAKTSKEASEPKGSRPGPYQPVKASAKGGGKGRGRGKSDFRSKGSGPMPKELVGNPSKDSQGRNICFAYNLPGGCPDAKDGESCSRGMHICIKRGCNKAHSLQHHKDH